MSVLSDKWIKKMALEGMNSPFEEKQIKENFDKFELALKKNLKKRKLSQKKFKKKNK